MILTVLPASFVVFAYYPSLKPVMNLLVLLPFSVPPVVSSVGLLELFSEEPLLLTGTPWLLSGAYFTLALPFMYRAIANNLDALDLQGLMDAARLLGAGPFRLFVTVILPNLKTGILVSVFLCFSLLFGEFVFANILVGSQFETIQVYLFNMRFFSGHFSSAIVMSYFLILMVLTLLASKWGKV
ncbi:ABC transporter permease [Endozoicomonas sp. OPT23]|uniref:ABC transporter permease n=1 Tax=Endozoicomonas sp. OPT23 TaxID=2072845 RepID=UPI001E447194|nr:ABC transporter permease subunit [Endozoicomonas sp. OPT23]